MAVEEQVLVGRTLAGDTEAFGALVERYSGLVYSLILEVVRRPEDAEDLAQEVFCKAYQELPSLRQPSRFPPWLAQIAHHAALDWLRQEQARSRVEELGRAWAAPAPAFLPDGELEARERADLLWAALDRLPPEHRRVVALYYLEGCTYRQIARFLGLPLATVRWRLLRSERRLGQELGRMLGQERRLGSRDRQELRDKVLGSLPIGLWPVLGRRAPWWSLGNLSQRLLPWAPAAVLVGLAGSGLLYLAGSGELGRFWAGEGGRAGVEGRSGWTAPPRIRLGRPGILPEQFERPRPSQDLSSLPEVQALLSARVAGDSLLPPEIGPVSLPLEEPRSGARPGDGLPGLPAPSAAPERRPLPGQVAFASLRVRGAGSYTGPGNALADVARYLTDHTPVEARLLESASYSGFHSPELLRYPIHFLLQGAGMPQVDGTPATQFSPEEIHLLGQYLRQGGFLYVEGDQLFLGDMVQHLRQALEGHGKVLEVPLSHPLYHAFYDLDGGFPGEVEKGRYAQVPGPEWYYPANRDGTVPTGLGLWGVELEGELVALLYDGSLLRNWEPDGSTGDADQQVPIKSPRLAAATNVVVYALSRPHGLAMQQGQPAGQ